MQFIAVNVEWNIRFETTTVFYLAMQHVVVRFHM
jgi:hypothetical protein